MEAEFASKSVLIVEDEIFILASMEATLLEAGIGSVEIALTLAEAEAALADRDKFDLVILDARLPDGDTLSLAEQLLGQDKCVVFHSGTVEPSFVADFRNAVFCQKPSTPESLIEAMKASLNGIVG